MKVQRDGKLHAFLIQAWNPQLHDVIVKPSSRSTVSSVERFPCPTNPESYAGGNMSSW
jgi:hypothetical protein